MKLREFEGRMQKPVFSVEEARRVAWKTSPAVFQLQLHHWTKNGELARIRRGIYGFPDLIKDKTEVARALYGPAYISLEYALNIYYDLIPDVAFGITLVTTRVTRKFSTPYGAFYYHKIRPDLFWGYDPATLQGEREKVLIDYLYFKRGRLIPKPDFWDSMRWQNLDEVDFTKAKRYAKRFPKKVSRLIHSLEEYGKTQKTR